GWSDPPDGEPPRARRNGTPRVQPHRDEQRDVGREHRVERTGDPETQKAEGRERGTHAERAPGPEQSSARSDEVPHRPERPQDPGVQRPVERAHAVGTSVLSRIALRAASAVTPSSSSSGATLTRWRSTVGASAFTSSGITKSRPSSSAAARAALRSDTPARGLAPSVSEAASRVARTTAAMYAV